MHPLYAMIASMRMLSVAMLAVFGVWQAADIPIERGTLRLHYVQKPIGYERYAIVKDGAALQLTSEFDFTDRGGRVQLSATLRTKPDFTPVLFHASGKSYRFVNVDSDVKIAGSDARIRADGVETRVTLPAQFYTVDGYAPFAAQMLMLRYWKQHGQPRVLQTVPGQPTSDVIIEARGREAIRLGDKVITLNRFAVDGVVWGREALWLDDRDSLAAAITPLADGIRLTVASIRDAAFPPGPARP